PCWMRRWRLRFAASRLGDPHRETIRDAAPDSQHTTSERARFLREKLRWISSETTAWCWPDSPDNWCESPAGSGHISRVDASSRRNLDDPVRAEPIGAGWKRKSGGYCSPGGRHARRHSGRLPRKRCECRYGEKRLWGRV